MECPKCGYTLGPLENECPRCKAQPTASSPPRSAQQAFDPSAPPPVQCPACQNWVSSLSYSCPHCGCALRVGAGGAPHVAGPQWGPDAHLPDIPGKDEPWADRSFGNPGNRLCSWGSVVAVSILLTIVGFIIGLIGVSGARRQRAKQWATRYLVGAIVVGAFYAMIALPVLMGLSVRSLGERSKEVTLTAHMTTLQNAVDLYHNDMKRYPARLEDVASTTNPDPNYHGPYLRAVPRHPYGGTYLLDPVTGKVSEKH